MIPPVFSLFITALHPVGGTGGLTQAINVIPLVRSSEAESLMVTVFELPLNESAEPNFPEGFQVAPLSVPLLLFPEISDAVVPVPSFIPIARTIPAPNGGGVCVVAFAVLDNTELFPELSYAEIL